MASRWGRGRDLIAPKFLSDNADKRQDSSWWFQGQTGREIGLDFGVPEDEI